MSQGVIVRRKAGQAIPVDFLNLVLEKCPKAWGIAYVLDGKLEVNTGTDLDVETIQNTLDNLKDVDVTFYFAENTSAATNLNDIPPYPMIANDDGSPLVALIPEGNFPGFEKKESSHPASFHLGIEVMNTFDETFELLDKNLDKFMDKISTPLFDKKMKLHSVSRGYITVLAQNGRAVTFSQGDTDKEFPWGWTSNTFGYGAEVKPKEEPKAEKKTMFPGRSTTREKHVPPSNAVQATGADNTGKKDTAVKAPEGGTPSVPSVKPKPVILTLENITVKKVKIPGHLSRKNRRGWIKERLGYTPPTANDPDQEYEIYTSPTGATLTKKEVQKALGVSAAKLPVLDNPKPTGKGEPQHIDPDKQVTNQPLPILSPTARTRLKEFISDERIKKIISENAVAIADPDRVQGHEGKIPAFKEQLGMKDTKDFDHMPFELLLKVAATSFHDVCVIANDWRNRMMDAEVKLAKYNKKANTETKSETPPKVEEKPKKTMFPGRAA